ncbi:LysR family transcriptional regulator [Lacticaseibacillus kribbianus]|uniref:LysR family transcriptional regulator n=1 Tax=Lacticaseibacillus kribbianus TaxID=2926292 RepID=UPI001CD3F739|nr:LysR family transcriptional regulator [Lacticaseibacillus kribbianus]
MKNLATFKAVYETRSFSRAAALLFISQPTVSAQIKQLETEFGCRLFERNGRGRLGVTPAATQLYQAASDLLASWDQLHTALAAGPAEQRVRLAASHTFATALLPQLLPRLYAQFPRVRFEVTMANSYAVQTAVAQHDADLGFIEKPLVASGLDRTTLMADSLVLAGAGEPFLVRESDSGVGYYTARYLAEHNAKGPRLTVASNAVIVALLHQGFGRSLLSARAAQGLATQPLGPDFVRHFYLLTRSGDQAVAAQVAAVAAWAAAYRD